jgi:hypothetical protein
MELVLEELDVFLLGALRGSENLPNSDLLLIGSTRQSFW